MEGAGCLTYTAARYRGAMEMLWLHFWGPVITTSVFIFTLQSMYPTNSSVSTHMLGNYLITYQPSLSLTLCGLITNFTKLI